MKTICFASFISRVLIASVLRILLLQLCFLQLPLSAAWSQVSEAPSTAPSTDNPLVRNPSKKLERLEKVERLRILYYKPVYFAYSNPLTKLQYSFRAPLTEWFPVSFAYSQLIFWKLHEDSKPFLDATYNPELFYRWKAKTGDLQTIDFGIWEHNSNGRGGEGSRSFDQSYLRFNFAFEGRRWITQFTTKLRFIYNKDETNSDISDYISPIEFQVQFLQLFDYWFDESAFSLAMKPGGEYAHRWDRGGYEAGLSFRLGGLKIIPAFYLQYYHGYAESLLTYNKRVDQFRVGLLF